MYTWSKPARFNGLSNNINRHWWAMSGLQLPNSRPCFRNMCPCSSGFNNSNVLPTCTKIINKKIKTSTVQYSIRLLWRFPVVRFPKSQSIVFRCRPSLLWPFGISRIPYLRRYACVFYPCWNIFTDGPIFKIINDHTCCCFQQLSSNYHRGRYHLLSRNRVTGFGGNRRTSRSSR